MPDQMYSTPFFLVVISTISSIVKIKIFPSPSDPVCDASVITETTSSTLESSTTTNKFKTSLYLSI